MLEKSDLQAIKEIMDEVVRNNSNMILSQLDRVQDNMDSKIGKVESNLDVLKQYYKINKLESDNTALLLQMIKDLRAELEELKKKIA